MKYKFTKRFVKMKSKPEINGFPFEDSLDWSRVRLLPKRFIKEIREGEDCRGNFISYKINRGKYKGVPHFYMLKFNFYWFLWGFYIEKICKTQTPKMLEKINKHLPSIIEVMNSKM